MRTSASPSPITPVPAARPRGGRASVALAVLVAVIVALVVPAGRAEAAGRRFVDPVFPSATVTSDLVYGTAPHKGEPFDLKLDLYEPAGDTAERRPLMVWIHGGGFQQGDKAGPLEKLMGEAYARRGYVVASIGYRLASGNLGQDIANAYADAEAAVAWLRDHADDHRIDTSRVTAAGMSAGAVTSLALGTRADVVADPSLLEGPSHVDAVVSLAGNNNSTWAQPGEPPILMLHGVDDELIGHHLAVDYCAAVDAAGVPCELVSYDDSTGFPATHVGFLGNMTDIQARMSAFLFDELGLAAWSPITFLDVPGDHRFHDDIAWMATAGLTEGYPGPTFRPTTPVTRQTMAAFLRRLSDHLGGPTGPVPDPGFADVPATSPFSEDIAWLAAHGITTGVPGPTPGTLTFEPTAPVSRQAMAAFLHRLDELLEDAPDAPAPDPGFTDVPATSTFFADIAWAVQSGVAEGFPGPTFRPTAPVTRQAMAAFLHRLTDHLDPVGPPLA